MTVEDSSEGAFKGSKLGHDRFEEGDVSIPRSSFSLVMKMATSRRATTTGKEKRGTRLRRKRGMKRAKEKWFREEKRSFLEWVKPLSLSLSLRRGGRRSVVVKEEPLLQRSGKNPNKVGVSIRKKKKRY